ncbi:MAG: CsgG/HfaB family protein [Fibrobacterota bacterium]
MKKTILLLLSLAALCFSQKTEKRMTGAVSELEGRGLAAGEALTLTDALSSHLSNTNTFRIMERGKMDMILKEQGFQQSGACTDQACVVEMGQLLGVQQMITGSIGKVGGTYSVNIRMINVTTSEIIRTVSKVYKGQIDGVLTDIMPVVANELAQAVSPSAAPVAAVPAATAAPASAPVPAPAPASQPAVAKSDGGSNTLLWVGLGVLAVGGGVAAFVVLNKDDNTTPTDNGSTRPGVLEFTW